MFWQSQKQEILRQGLRKTFGVLNHAAPKLAARLALRVFLTPPPRRRVPAVELQCLADATRIEVPDARGLAVWSWGQGPVVVLAHGWGGRGGQMKSFVKPLVDRGFRVVAFDGPAHGQSRGARTDMVEFARVINAVCAHVGPVEAIVGHSFGAACSLIALREHGLSTKKLVLIACPPNAIWVTEQFGTALGVTPGVLSEMRSRLERRHRGTLSWADLSMVEMVRRLPIPILLIHDRDDRMIPYGQAAEVFLQQVAGLAHFATEGLGHGRVLTADTVVAKTLEFLEQPLVVAPPAEDRAGGPLEERHS